MTRSLLLVAALALLGPAAARADRGATWIGLELGPSLPARDFAQSARTGFQGGLSVTRMESRHVGAGVDVAIHAWDGSDEANGAIPAFLGPGATVRFHAIEAGLHVLYDLAPEGKARPYVIGGAGLYSVKTSLVTGFGTIDGRGWDFGYDVGAGVVLGDRPSYAIGLGGTYHVVQTTGFDMGLATVGVTLMWGPGRR